MAYYTHDGIRHNTQEEALEYLKQLIQKSEWFNDEVIGTKLTDFFNKCSVNYTKYANSIKENTLFSPNSEFEQEGADNSKAMVNAVLRMRMLTL